MIQVLDIFLYGIRRAPISVSSLDLSPECTYVYLSKYLDRPNSSGGTNEHRWFGKGSSGAFGSFITGMTVS